MSNPSDVGELSCTRSVQSAVATRMKTFALLLCILFLYLSPLQETKTPEQGGGFPVQEWTIDGQKRQALVIPPSKASEGGAPVVFVFHGHGGSMYRMAQLGFQKHWKEAYIVCPQGLPTTSKRDPEGKLPGWQTRAGEYHNRDLKFFDAILKTLREKHKIDPARVYATGHSNGGFFTYLLWGERGETVRAIAPSACHANNIRSRLGRLRLIPVMQLIGEGDPIVPSKYQQQSADAVKRFFQCESEGKPWAKTGSLVGALYPSSKGAPFVEVIHPHGHKYPAEAPELIVRFFKELGGGASTSPEPSRAPN